MSLNNTQKDLIRKTWKIVEDGGLKEAGMVMFIKLFEDNPHFIPLFNFADKQTVEELKHSDRLARHATGVMKTVAVAVENLDEPGAIQSPLHDLGGRHYNYKIQPEYFQPVGAALLYALEQRTGEAFTEEAKQAWVEVFGVVSDTMKGGFHSRAASKGQ